MSRRVAGAGRRVQEGTDRVQPHQFRPQQPVPPRRDAGHCERSGNQRGPQATQRDVREPRREGNLDPTSISRTKLEDINKEDRLEEDSRFAAAQEADRMAAQQEQQRRDPNARIAASQVLDHWESDDLWLGNDQGSEAQSCEDQRMPAGAVPVDLEAVAQAPVHQEFRQPMMDQPQGTMQGPRSMPSSLSDRDHEQRIAASQALLLESDSSDELPNGPNREERSTDIFSRDAGPRVAERPVQLEDVAVPQNTPMPPPIPQVEQTMAPQLYEVTKLIVEGLDERFNGTYESQETDEGAYYFRKNHNVYLKKKVVARQGWTPFYQWGLCVVDGDHDRATAVFQTIPQEYTTGFIGHLGGEWYDEAQQLHLPEVTWDSGRETVKLDFTPSV